MKLLFWNCRGLNSADSPTVPFLCWLVRKFSSDMLFLMETKSESILISRITLLLGFSNFVSCDANGLPGDLGVFLEWHG